MRALRLDHPLIRTWAPVALALMGGFYTGILFTRLAM